MSSPDPQSDDQDIDLRLKRLDRKFFNLVHDYKPPPESQEGAPKEKNAGAILIESNSAMAEVKCVCKGSINAENFLDQQTEELISLTDEINADIETIFNAIGMEMPSYGDKNESWLQQEGDESMEQEENQSPERSISQSPNEATSQRFSNVFITRASPKSGENFETPAIKSTKKRIIF